MISRTAVGHIEALQAKGLKPSVEDIIRLNAMGLKLEAARKKVATSSTYYLPRVASVSNGETSFTFRQPAVGHEIWLEKVERLVEPTYETALAVKAFALSRTPDQLPDPDDADVVKTAVGEFSAQFFGFTRDQIFAALDYVIHGSSPIDGEHPALVKNEDDDREPDGSEADDWKTCIALGVLNEGRAVLWGMNQREMEAMTRRQLEDVIRRAYKFHHMGPDSEEDERVEDYYATLDEIENRLKSQAVA